MNNIGTPVHPPALHVDSAWMGMVLPFCPDAPVWNLMEPLVDSISISRHKSIGAPIPRGVVLARKRHVERIARSVYVGKEYVGKLDITIMGSRVTLPPLGVLWHVFQTHGIDHDSIRDLARLTVLQATLT